MNPNYTPGSLFLTPRAPNGKRLPARARHHMRGSEDGNDKPKLSGREQMGIGGQMMANRPDAAGPAGKPAFKNDVPRDLSSQHPLQQPGAPKELSGQVPAPDKKPLVTQQDLATARHLEEMRQRSEKARQAGYQDPGSMTWNERNRYNSTLPKQTQERGDGQMNNHMAVGGEYSKLFGMDERGELGAGIIFKTNPHMPFEPFDEKDARDAFIKRSWGKMEK